MKKGIPTNHLTGVILAGGKSSRFGSDKAFAPYEGERLIDHNLRVIKRVFQEVLIVANASENYVGVTPIVLADEIPFQGPAGGIVRALRFVKTEGVFVTACDMPLLSEKVILNLLDKDDGSAFICYQHGNILEPLCAIYRRRLLPLLELRLKAGRRDLHSLCNEPGIRSRKVPLPDTFENTLSNINTLRDLESLRTESAGKQPPKGQTWIGGLEEPLADQEPTDPGTE